MAYILVYTTITAVSYMNKRTYKLIFAIFLSLGISLLAPRCALLAVFGYFVGCCGVDAYLYVVGYRYVFFYPPIESGGG